jgi:hypothetical protein
MRRYTNCQMVVGLRHTPFQIAGEVGAGVLERDVREQFR